MMVWIGLLLLDNARKQIHTTHKQDKLNFLYVSQNNSSHSIIQNQTIKLSRYKAIISVYCLSLLTTSSNTFVEMGTVTA